MTNFGEIPPLSASSNVFYSYMLSANYVTIGLLNTLIVDIADLKTQLDDVNTSIDKGSNAASLLASEYFSNQDLDGDSLIYGVDFYITDCPAMLSTIPARGTIRTWAQYKDLHPDLF
jgi:hypothetical protein